MSGRRVESFLLRLVVHEPRTTDGDSWRGRIQHVASGYERQFERIEDMFAFIAEQVAGGHSLLITYDERLGVE
jgi:hypothetical protein